MTATQTVGPSIELQQVPKSTVTATTAVEQEITEATGITGQGTEVVASTKLSKPDLIRLIAAIFAFFCSGINDGSLGPLIPYLLRYYNLNTNFVAIIYGITFTGWFSAAIINSHLTQLLDLGAILTLGALAQLIAQCLRAWGPPFGLFVASFWFAHIGQAYQDMHANSWVATVKAAHRWLGFIHAAYMFGCLVGPFVATAVASSTDGTKWYLFYTFPLGINVLNVLATAYAFRDTLRLKRSSNAEREEGTSPATRSRNKDALKEIRETLGIRSVWILSLYFFFFLGTAITAGGKFKPSVIIIHPLNTPRLAGHLPCRCSQR